MRNCRHLARIEARLTSWTIPAVCLLVALAFALVARNMGTGLATQAALIRMGSASLAVGVLLSLEQHDGEISATFVTPVSQRLVADSANLVPIWLVSEVLVLVVSGPPRLIQSRLMVEAVVLALVAVLLGAIGYRVVVPHFTTAASLFFAAGFTVSLLLPSDLNPWWTWEAADLIEPSLSPWVISGVAICISVALIGRRANLWWISG